MTGLFRSTIAVLLLCSTAMAPAQEKAPTQEKTRHDEAAQAADRAEIHALLVAYGSTIDARDFTAFAALFGPDGTYVTGGREMNGEQAATMLRDVFAANAQGHGEPNFHLFFNEVIHFEGPDRARATSLSLWMVPGPDKRPVAALSARYEDAIVRDAGRWRFATRRVLPLTNGQTAKPTAGRP